MLRNILTALIFSFSVFSFAAHAADPAKPVKIRIAAATDLHYALDAIEAGFQKTHPDVKFEIVYGSSGLLTQQILAGANFDLFLSADSEYPAQLKEKSKVNGDAFQYGSGRLVLWTSKNSGVKLDAAQGLKILLQKSVMKIAIANPDHAPYGRAAEAALKQAGIYDQVKPKLVVAENIAQAAQFAMTRAAQVGLIAYALAASPELKKEGESITIREAEPLRQSGVVLAASKDLKNAQAVRDYILGTHGQAILSSFGFKKE